MNIKKTVLASVLGLGLALPALGQEVKPNENNAAVVQTQAPSPKVTGTIDAVIGDGFLDDYGRVIANYSLPKGINGFTFIEAYQHGQGYFGKTYLSTNHKINPLLEIDHTNAIAKGLGIGVRVSPKIKGFYYVSLDAERIFTDGEKPETMLGVSFALEVPHMNVGAFWRFNKTSNQSDYGEVTISFQAKHFEIGYNPALVNKGKKTPGLDHRLTVSARYNLF